MTNPLALSTLGLPGASLATAVTAAVRGGCAGLELRSHPETGVHPGMSSRERSAARAALAAAGLTALTLAGYTRIAEPGDDDAVSALLAAEIRLAADLGARYVRVFPGGTDEEAAVRRLRAAAPLAAAARVVVAVETHDSHPTGAAVARLLDAAAVPETTAAIWDLLHPWRSGETPAETLANLDGRLAYVQVKDVMSAEDTTPVPLGTGCVPLTDAARTLRRAGYAGWVSLEWERTWHPQVAPVQDVLPGAAAWARSLSCGGTLPDLG
ncbi:TIM barrel protein [Actinomadura fulvescens]|uniref:Sugar phosphate isomerase/epimerase n=1 Tax=Actinomadura fulvescens TaxID=46160 RepID=A0ABP6CZU4_9ACTN